MSGFGSGIGAVVRIGTVFFGIILIGNAFLSDRSDAAIWTQVILGIFLIGLGQGVAHQMAQGQWRVPGVPSVSSIGSPSYRRPGQRLVMHGFLWVILWMAVGAALSLSLLPLFPDLMVEWVDQGQKWTLELKGKYFG